VTDLFYGEGDSRICASASTDCRKRGTRERLSVKVSAKKASIGLSVGWNEEREGSGVHVKGEHLLETRARRDIGNMFGPQLDEGRTKGNRETERN